MIEDTQKNMDEKQIKNQIKIIFGNWERESKNN